MEILRRIRSTPIFVVSDIMVPIDEFTRADNIESAHAVFDAHPDYDLLPIPSQGVPTHVVFRSDMSKHKIDLSMLISEATAILHLPRLFSERHEAFFVLGDHDISGLVHFSDLNNPLCKIPFFALVHMVERKYIETIKGHFSEQRALEALGSRKAQALFMRASDMANRDVLPFPAAAMYFKELLTYSRFYDFVKISDEEITDLNEFRNRFAHGGRTLITASKDCETLASIQRLCARLLDNGAP